MSIKRALRKLGNTRAGQAITPPPPPVGRPVTRRAAMGAAAIGGVTVTSPVTGGLTPAPQNAPQSVPPTVGTQPGQSTAILRARQVIISGSGDGEWVYNGAPAANNLVASVTTGNPASPGTTTPDPTGHNAVLPGIVTYGFSSLLGAYVAIQVFGQAIYYYTAATEAGPWTLGPNVSLTAGSILTLNGETVVNGNLIVGAPTAGFTVDLVHNQVIFADPAVATQPGSPAAEIWHTITLDAGWSTGGGYAVPSYRLTPQGDLQLAGRASFSFTSAAAVQLNSGNPLPAAYHPVSTHDPRTSDLIGSRCHIALSTAGVLAATPPSGATFPGTYFAEIDSMTELTL